MRSAVDSGLRWNEGWCFSIPSAARYRSAGLRILTEE